MDYRKTLNLPKTDFPMRANLPELEPKIQEFWERIDIYKLAQEKNKDKPKYILHDGPPFTSGDIHIGQALNKILKDVIIKYKTMRGFNAPYIPGWDTHGLPTELRAIESFRIDPKEIDPLELRKKCFQFASRFVEVQRRQFKRLGVRGDWENPYLTLSPQYEAKVLEVFKELVKKGYVYRGLKPVYWCPKCETALSEMEIEYRQKESPSIYVKFPLIDEIGPLREKLSGRKVHFVIWTTTPWTLPANVAIAVHPDLPYVALGINEEALIVAQPLVEMFTKTVGISQYQVLGRLKGEKLENLRSQHPFLERESLIVLANYVREDEGTGCVHTAPGHGKEDYETALKYNLPVLVPIDGRGVFTAEMPMLAGLGHEEANEAIIEKLRKDGYLLHQDKVLHDYPHCWRCGSPIVFRATKQWFMEVGKFTKEALEAVKKVRWIPSWGEDRIENMIKESPDWCFSRQRAWGIPIPVMYCQDCEEPLLLPEVIDKVIEEILRRGDEMMEEGRDPSDIWFEKPEEEFLSPLARCQKCGGEKFRKGTDTFIVWFDSSVSHRAVMETREELGFPADLYLEGHDQYRLWYQGSLWTAVATRGQAPCKAVLTHGFVLDETGKKMSKSLGNIIDPQVVANNYGADLLRLWVTYVDFKNDMPMSEDIFEQVTETYRKIRNTIRFMLGNLYDFEPAVDRVAISELLEIDRWALLRLQRLIQRLNRAYEEFEFHLFYHLLMEFCVVDLSAFYFDVLKDRLYTWGAKSLGRRAAQTVIYEILVTLTKLMAPILTHSAEEIWQQLRSKGEKEASVQLAAWPEANETYIDGELESRWERILEVRAEVYKALEIAKNNKVISQPLAAQVRLFCPPDIHELLSPLEEELKYIFIVSQVNLERSENAPRGTFRSQEIPGLEVLVKEAEGKKCERCWLYSKTVGEDKEHPTICRRCLETLKEYHLF